MTVSVVVKDANRRELEFVRASLSASSVDQRLVS